MSWIKQIKKLNFSNTTCLLPQAKKLGFAGYLLPNQQIVK
jgi:hypothetical protein